MDGRFPPMGYDSQGIDSLRPQRGCLPEAMQRRSKRSSGSFRPCPYDRGSLLLRLRLLKNSPCSENALVRAAQGTPLPLSMYYFE